MLPSLPGRPDLLLVGLFIVNLVPVSRIRRRQEENDIRLVSRRADDDVFISSCHVLAVSGEVPVLGAALPCWGVLLDIRRPVEGVTVDGVSRQRMGDDRSGCDH